MMAKIAKAVKAAHRRERKLTDKVTLHREHVGVRAAGTLSDVADQPPLVALNLATVAAGLVLRRPALVRTGVRMLAAHALATGIKTVVKKAVDRTRPHARLDGKRDRLRKGASDTHDHSSFPSGHTAGAVAVAAAASRDAPALAPYAHGTAGAVAAIQVPRAAHYASDVVAGAVIGWLAEKVASAIIARGEGWVTKRGRRG